MHEDILKKLERRVGRRTFLRGSALAAAAVAGTAMWPGLAFAQDPAKPEEQKPEDERKDGTEASKDDEEKKDEEARAEGSTDKSAEAKDPFKETKRDADGREYRLCPQCGYNMYKQDRTWTCENCGYSYVE